MQYVILGNGTAATEATEAIRQRDVKGKISVISEEKYANYSRPLISYLLGRKIARKDLPFRKSSFYRDNQVKLILNRKATKLEPKQKDVILSDRQKIPYDKLLIAIGGIPIIPEIKGARSEGVFTFTKLDDALLIEKYIKRNQVKKALVLGGGLIGLKATEPLIELGIKVTIVELADRILSSTFDRKASGIIEHALEKIGCSLITQDTVKEIRPKNKKVAEVILRDGKRILCDMVIVAVGVRPNIELVKNTAIKTNNRGILVDNFMQTTLKDVYAAGDCCAAKDMLVDENRSIAIWPIAAKQGRLAGLNMTGEKEEYAGAFAMNSVEVCGIPTISVGLTDPQEKAYQILEHFNPDKSVYKKIVLKNNRIVGAIFVGNIERAGIYTGLIKDRVDVSSFKEYLLKDEFGLVSLPKEYRKHLVGEEVAMI
jgi:NAD(P)H-nitrite reductase large subunit